MANARHRPNVLLHIGQEIFHIQLVIDRIFEPAAGIRDGTAEARTDHDETGCDRLRETDARTGSEDGGIRTAHTWSMVGREHHDTLDDFRFLFRNQTLVPEESDDMGNLVALVDEFGSRIAVVTGFVSSVVADGGADERSDH